MKVIKALIFLSLAALMATEPCADFIHRMYDRRMMNNTENLTQEESQFIDYSGTDFFIPSLGIKSACDASPDMIYLFAVKSVRPFDYVVWISYGYAACLPKYCASVPGLSTDQELITTLFLARGWPLAQDTDYAIHYRLEDPNHWEKPFMFYPGLALFAIFTLVTIVSSWYLYKKRQNRSQPTDLQLVGFRSHLQGIMEAFDLKKNTFQLYQTAKEQGTNEDLAIFQFLRTCSAYWVIHFHTGLYYKIFCIAWWVSPAYKAFEESPLFWLQSADAVFNFFFMGGFFAVYAMVTKLAAAPFGVKAFWEQLKHRILRIWPIYMILLILYSQIGPFLWSGPSMYLYQSEAAPCQSGLEILAKAFFMDGLLNRFITPTTGGLCWGSTWYIASEFHIYWVAIIAVGVYAKSRRWGRVLIVALILQSYILAHTRYAIYNNFQGEYARLWEAKHIRTPCTIWYTFFTGAFWGALYFEYSKEKKYNIFSIFEKYPIVSYLTMAVGFVLTIDIRANYLFEYYKFPIAFPVFRSMIYDTSVALIYMPLLANRPYLIKKLMNMRFFQVAGKTSFVVYLLHDFVFRSILMNLAEVGSYDYLAFTGFALLGIFIAQMLGFWVHLCIEKPLTNVEMHFTRKKKPEKIKSPTEVQFVELAEDPSKNESYIAVADGPESK